MQLIDRVLRRIGTTVAAAGLVATTVLAAPVAMAVPAAPASGPPAGPVAAGGDAATARAVADWLGEDSGGAYLDRSSGRMVVTITEQADAAMVREAGAVPRLVRHGAGALERATRALTRSLRLAGTAWSVDPASNAVVVSLDSTVGRAEERNVTALTRRFGDAVRVERVTGEFRTSKAGGQDVHGAGYRCSLGFNVRNASTYFFLTAGHCTDLASRWYGNSAETIRLGSRTGSSFPGNDYGIVRYDKGVSHPGTVNLHGAGSQDITRAASAYVGEPVRRSGSTTGVHSGRVTGLGATVNYAEGRVSGLIKTNVCAESGDSGGSLFHGRTALGLTSGGNGNCFFGGTTYFQPVKEVLNRYNVRVY